MKLTNLLAKKFVLDTEIATEKLHLHEEFTKKYSKQLRILDILAIVIILCNFGAATLTNMLVMKESTEMNKTMVFYEANPVQQQVNNYTPYPDQEELRNTVLFPLLKLFLTWLIMLTIYIFVRRTIYLPSQLTLLVFVLVWYFWTLGYDMAHDLGYMIGRIIYG